MQTKIVFTLDSLYNIFFGFFNFSYFLLVVYFPLCLITFMISMQIVMNSNKGTLSNNELRVVVVELNHCNPGKLMSGSSIADKSIIFTTIMERQNSNIWFEYIKSSSIKSHFICCITEIIAIVLRIDRQGTEYWVCYFRCGRLIKWFYIWI